MKYLFAPLAVACMVAAVVAAPALAAEPAGNGGPFDSVTGSMQRFNLAPFSTEQVDGIVSAHQSPQGGAHGMFTLRNEGNGLDYTGDVTCINAIGNRAVIGIRFTKSNSARFPVGGGQFVFFVDNGPPSAVNPQRDAFSPGPPLAKAPTECTLLLPDFTRPFISANFVIHDGS